MDFIEGGVVHIAGVNTRPQPPHQPGPCGLAENGRSHGVNPDEPQIRVRFTQHPRYAGRVTPGSDRADEYVDRPQLR